MSRALVLLVPLVLAALALPLVEAQVYTPPVTSRCVSSATAQVGACLEWGGEGCAVLVRADAVGGPRCLLEWPPLP